MGLERIFVLSESKCADIRCRFCGALDGDGPLFGFAPFTLWSTSETGLRFSLLWPMIVQNRSAVHSGMVRCQASLIPEWRHHLVSSCDGSSWLMSLSVPWEDTVWEVTLFSLDLIGAQHGTLTTWLSWSLLLPTSGRMAVGILLTTLTWKLLDRGLLFRPYCSWGSKAWAGASFSYLCC